MASLGSFCIVCTARGCHVLVSRVSGSYTRQYKVAPESRITYQPHWLFNVRFLNSCLKFVAVIARAMSEIWP